MTDHWGEPRNQTGEVHPAEPFDRPERSCDRVVLLSSRLKWFHSSLMGGGLIVEYSVIIHVVYCCIDRLRCEVPVV